MIILHRNFNLPIKEENSYSVAEAVTNVKYLLVLLQLHHYDSTFVVHIKTEYINTCEHTQLQQLIQT